MSLSAKQRAFVDEYLKCRNASEAARRAGYAENSAHVAGSRLLSNDKVSQEIERRIKEKAMEADEVISRLADMARGTMEDFVSFTHEPYPAFTLDLGKARERGVLHLIHELSYDSNGNPKIKLYDAKDAAQLLGRYHKLFTDRMEHDVRGEVEITSDDMVKARQDATAFEDELLSEDDA